MATQRAIQFSKLLRNPPAAARAAQLRYVSPNAPGIRRLRRGRAFVYVTPNGARIKDPDKLRRIASLAIPPAWRDVWICPSPHGHIQATGYDTRGRKQYRYHPRWRSVRDEAKYHDILLFGERLPKLRMAIERDLASAKLSKDKVVATVLKIMEQTAIRVGNDKYLEENGSHGLTTLLDRHAKISGGLVEFQFRGKGGKPYRAALRDRRLAAIVKRCRDVPGQRLFQYVEGQHYRPITSTDVNDYIRNAMGHPFTAKAFRTWSGTAAALVILYGCTPCRSATAGKKTIVKAVEQVAAQLGNTRAICKKCYVHPAVFDSYLTGELHDRFSECLARARAKNGLTREECALLAFFERLAPKTLPIAA